MAQTGYTPIALYYSTTASAAPAAGNLTNGELAINITDKKLYAKDNAGNVFVLADASSGGTTATNLAGGAAGSVPYQSGASTTTFLSLGTAAQVLQVNAGATAPEWVSSTGTGNVVRATSPTIATPTITTSATVPLLIGGTGTTSTLTLRSTSGVGAAGADIIFQTGNNGATEAMRVLNSGNVGIGTNNPTQLLHVAGTSTKALVTTSSTTGFASAMVQNDSATNDLELIQYGTAATSTYFGVNRAGASFLGASSTVLGIGTKGATPVLFATNNVERMRIDSSGNVGIGNTSPGTRLHVTNAAGTYNSTADNSVAIYVNSTTAAATGNFQGLQFAATSGNSLNSTFTIGISSPATGYSPDLVFSQRTGVSTYAERMRIDGSGNVGIGTASPANKLSVFVTDSSVYAPTTAFVNPVRVENQSNTTGSGAGITFFSRNASAVSGAHILASVSTSSDNNNDFIIQQRTGPATWAERVRLTSAGYFGIGTTAAARPLHVVSVDPGMFIDRNAGNPAVIGLRSARGSLASPTQSLANDYLGSLGGFGYNDAAAFTSTAIANINFYAAENITTTAQGSYITLSTTASGTTTLSERMRIDASGNVGIGITPSGGTRLQVTDASSTAYTSTSASLVAPTGARLSISNNNATNGTFGGILLAATNTATNSAIGYIGAVSGASNYVCDMVFGTRTGATAYAERMRITSAGNVVVTGAGGLGYGTGSGGAVTQATSRTTGVTLDKTNGAITLVSAAGTTTWQTFTVTNNTVAATDTIIVNQKSGADLYEIHVTAVAAGSFNISFKTTGGTTTEQPVFNFAVIKAVVA